MMWTELGPGGACGPVALTIDRERGELGDTEPWTPLTGWGSPNGVKLLPLLRRCFGVASGPEDQDAKIAELQHVPELGDTPERHGLLGDQVLRRFFARGSLEDLDRAVVEFEQALVKTPPGDPAIYGRLVDVAWACERRYDMRGARDEDFEVIVVDGRAAVAWSARSRRSNLGDGAGAHRRPERTADPASRRAGAEAQPRRTCSSATAETVDPPAPGARRRSAPRDRPARGRG